MLTVFVWVECALSMPFLLRFRLGQCEFEISGCREEVLATVRDLPSLVGVITEAFAQEGEKCLEDEVLPRLRGRSMV